MNRYTALPGILLLTLASGCFYELRDECTEYKIKMSNKCAATSAWMHVRRACAGLPCRHSYKDGFMEGFIAVANGGTGCVPAVPILPIHNHLWMDCRCGDGQKMEAWYDGYELGAMTARESGMADANRVASRIPHATPVDYSITNQSPMNSSRGYIDSGSTIPPSPVDDADDMDDADVIGGPQTSR